MRLIYLVITLTRIKLARVRTETIKSFIIIFARFLNLLSYDLILSYVWGGQKWQWLNLNLIEIILMSCLIFLYFFKVIKCALYEPHYGFYGWPGAGLFYYYLIFLFNRLIFNFNIALERRHTLRRICVIQCELFQIIIIIIYYL